MLLARRVERARAMAKKIHSEVQKVDAKRFLTPDLYFPADIGRVYPYKTLLQPASNPRGDRMDMVVAILGGAAVAVFGAAMVYAVISDLRAFRVPNWVSGLVVASFLVVASTNASPWPALLGNLITGLAVLAVGFALFAAGLFGAGDVKLLGRDRSLDRLALADCLPFVRGSERRGAMFDIDRFPAVSALRPSCRDTLDPTAACEKKRCALRGGYRDTGGVFSTQNSDRGRHLSALMKS